MAVKKVSYRFSKKNGTFYYRGTNKQVREKAQADLERLNERLPFETQLFQIFEKRYKTFCNKISVCKSAIATFSSKYDENEADV